MIRILLAFAVLAILFGWMVKADPVGKVAAASQLHNVEAH